jgi:M6 family metalloprotease-like protein
LLVLLPVSLLQSSGSDDCDCEICCDTTFTLGGEPEDFAVANVGTLKVLVVFARFYAGTDTTIPDNYCYRQWTYLDTVPKYASYFITPDTVPNDFEVPSMNDYYWKMSSGNLLVYGDCYPREVVTDYWSPNYSSETACLEVIGKVAADTNFDFIQFDVRPRDDVIDRVVLIWKVRAGETAIGSSAMMWSGDTTITTWDGVDIQRYSGPKVATGQNFARALSTTSHELWHGLSTAGSLGCYNAPVANQIETTWVYGVSTGHWERGLCMSAYVRYGLCWLQANDITQDTTDLVIPDAFTSSEVVRIFNPNLVQDTTEYFLLEYRHPDGCWYEDYGDSVHDCLEYEGHGLLIWHIDETVSSQQLGHHQADLESAWMGLFDPMPSTNPNPFYGYDELDCIDQFGRFETDSLRLDSLQFYRPQWNSTFTPYSNPNSNGYVEVEPGVWKQTVYTGISITNVRPGSGACTVDIHIDTLSTEFDSAATHIRHDTNWARRVILGSDVRVDDGITVTLSPGAVVSAVPDTDYAGTGADTDGVEIIVHGDLSAKGTSASPITFRPAGVGRDYSPQVNDWFGLRFDNEGGDTLRHCDVGYGYAGISLKGQFAFAGSTLISNCRVHDNLYTGIECFRSHAVIESTTIENNQDTEGGSIGLYLYHSGARTFRDTIRENLPYNVYSIGSHPDSGWKARIEDCFIAGEGKTDEDDSYGIVLSKGFADGSIISNTSANKNSQAGVSLLYNWGLVDIDACRVKKNYVGILADRKVTHLPGTSYVEISDSDIRNNATGVCVSKVGRAYVNLGDVSAGTGGGNNLTLNTTHAYNAGSTTQMAEDNWWGCSPPDTNKIMGQWDYQPYKQVAVTREALRPAWVDTPTLVAYPNPASGAIAFQLDLSHSSHVKFIVYDIRGRAVRTVFDEVAERGASQLAWYGVDDHGEPVGAGIYFCRVESGSRSETVKVVMLR